jgi:hypothetical protein
MEWLFWVTLIFVLITILVFAMLYRYSDIECVWPPCVSELIESHKNIVLVMTGFTFGLIWLNLMLLSLLVRAEVLVAMSTLIFFTGQGILAFDLSNDRRLHYIFVTMYAVASTAFANSIISDRLYVLTALVNGCTFLFMCMVVYTARDADWNPRTKHYYTWLECLWILAFFLYVLAHGFENRLAYRSLLLNCTRHAPHEQGLHTPFL